MCITYFHTCMFIRWFLYHIKFREIWHFHGAETDYYHHIFESKKHDPLHKCCAVHFGNTVASAGDRAKSLIVFY